MAERPQLSIITYRNGMYAVVEGNRDSERFYIIQKGIVNITKGGKPVLQEGGNATLGPGDFFGVVSSMAQKSQIETAQAITDTTLVTVNRNQYAGLIQFNTPIAMKIIQQFSRRMRSLNAQLTALTLSSSGEIDGSASLFSTASHYFKQKKHRIAVYAYKRFIQCYPHDLLIDKAREQFHMLEQQDKPNYQNCSTPFARQYPAGAPVFIEGESGDELFIIQSGSIHITKVIKGVEVMLAPLKTGDIFGEMAILESKPRSASAIAYEDSVLMIVQKHNFEGFAATQPQIISRLTKLLAERIWFSYKQIENANIKDPLGRCFDCLLIQLEKNNIAPRNKLDYTFNFGLEELAHMASIPEADIRHVRHQILENPKISLLSDNKILISDVMELVKLSEFYKKALKTGAHSVHS